jgi:hypothetical protein
MNALLLFLLIPLNGGFYYNLERAYVNSNSRRHRRRMMWAAAMGFAANAALVLALMYKTNNP